jgi:UDP-2-acetamido-3-amino-2,3-dideoxy-glucuronate N-acetyltransferase
MNQIPVRAHVLSDVRLIDLPRYSSHDGEVIVAEAASGLQFDIARMFTVKASQGAVRGKHAHRLCSQFMICVHGTIDVTCDDGENLQKFALDRGNLALFIPPTIWNTVDFRHSGSVLVVVCDRPYEEHDYIRDYSQFTAMRKAARA